MSKKITAFPIKSNEARVACTVAPESDIYKSENISCEANVHITDAHFMNYGEDKRYKPYMLLSGIVNSVKGDFPEKVNEIHFPSNKVNPKVTFKYDFNGDELAELVLKGMYDKNFCIPDIFPDNDWSLPVTCDCSYMMAENIPIMFIDIKNSTGIEINAENAGYGNLSQYFEPAREKGMDEGYINSFPDDEYDDDYYDENELMRNDDDYYEPVPVEQKTEEVRELTPEEKEIQQHLDNINEGVKAKRHKFRNNANSIAKTVQVAAAHESAVDEDGFLNSLEDDFNTSDEDDFENTFGTESDDTLNKAPAVDNSDTSYIFDTDSDMSMDERLKAMQAAEESYNDDDDEVESDLEDMNEDEDDPKNKNKKKKQVLKQIAQGDIAEAVAEEKIDVEKRHREAAAMDGFITNDDHKSGPEF